MKLKTSKKKLTASLILFIIALIGFVVGISFLVSGLVGEGKINYVAVEVPLVLYVVLMAVSFFLNRSYRGNSIVAGKGSTVLYVFQIIFLLPFIIIGLVAIIYLLMHGGLSQSEEQLKKIKITGDDGKEYILTQLYAGSNEYKDQNGDLWKTYDNGVTFERVTRKIETEDGKEHDLTPTWEDGIAVKKQFYNDEKGNEWVSEDGGQTFETVVKKVAGADGKEYTLTPRFAGSTQYYKDQNGDDWVTRDGGKTYNKE